MVKQNAILEDTMEHDEIENVDSVRRSVCCLLMVAMHDNAAPPSSALAHFATLADFRDDFT